MSCLIRFSKNILPVVLILFLFSRNTFALEDTIVAIVNSDVITLQDLKSYNHSIYVSLVTQGLSEEELRPIMLDLEVNGINKLIEDKLMLNEANKIGVVVRDKLVDDRIDEVKSRYPSEQVFMDALIKNGATLTDLKNKITDDFKIRFLIQSQVRNKIYVNPQEVTQYYEENQDKFSRKERIKLEAIYIPFGDNKEEAKQKVHEALKAVEDGQDFGQVAKTYSAPTSFGAVERGQLKPSLEDPLFKLDVNRHSGVIEVDDGYYIFLVTAKTPAKQAPLDEVKDIVTNEVFSEKFKKHISDYIDKLKKRAYIEIRQ